MKPSSALLLALLVPTSCKTTNSSSAKGTADSPVAASSTLPLYPRVTLNTSCDGIEHYVKPSQTTGGLPESMSGL